MRKERVKMGLLSESRGKLNRVFALRHTWMAYSALTLCLAKIYTPERKQGYPGASMCESEVTDRVLSEPASSRRGCGRVWRG